MSPRAGLGLGDWDFRGLLGLIHACEVSGPAPQKKANPMRVLSVNWGSLAFFCVGAGGGGPLHNDSDYANGTFKGSRLQ